MSFLQNGVSHRWRGEQHHSVGFAGPAESSVQDPVVEKAVVLVQLAEPEVFSVVLRQGVGVQQFLQCNESGVQHLLVADLVFIERDAIHHEVS